MRYALKKAIFRSGGRPQPRPKNRRILRPKARR